MTDLISRQAALKIVAKHIGVDGDKAFLIDVGKTYGEIYALPSAQPERKRGKWRYSRNISSISYSDMMVTCEQCGYSKERQHGDVLNFCPNCGADMRGTEE